MVIKLIHYFNFDIQPNITPENVQANDVKSINSSIIHQNGEMLIVPVAHENLPDDKDVLLYISKKLNGDE